MNIALHVLIKVGGGELRLGVTRVSAWCGKQTATVYRWTYPKERGGTDGFIPSDEMGTIMREARLLGSALQPADFFDPADLVAINDNVAGVMGINNEGVPALQPAPGVQA